MRERLQDYLDYMASINFDELSKEEIEKIYKDFMIQGKFFQNERLIHLIVTVTVVIVGVVTTLLNYILESIIVGCFLIPLLVLLFFYIRHYFFLERGVQKLYTYYDIMIKKLLD